MKKLIIVGADEPGFEILEIIKDLNKNVKKYSFVGFYDEYKKGKNIYNALNNLKQIAEDVFFVNSIGNIKNRKRTTNKLIKEGFHLETIISPLSYISPSAIIKEGVIVYPHASISSKSIIEDNVLINYNTSISHGVYVGRNTNISPGCNIAGKVHISNDCFLGIGVKIIPEIKIAKNVILGAGAVVIKDINDEGIYVGVPAKLLKR